MTTDSLERQLVRHREQLEASLASGSGDVLRQHPVADTIERFDDLSDRLGYAAVPAEVQESARRILDQAGIGTLEDYNKLLLVVLMQQHDVRAAARTLTPELEDRFGHYFSDLLAKMDKSVKNYYVYDNDAFVKDLAVCRMKLWPCGVEFADEAAYFPRRYLFNAGIGQFFEGMRCFVVRARGFGPFFETHFDHRTIGDFTPEGYNTLYRSLAELLECNPQIRGVIGSSWWHDPALESISPDLRFLTSEPLMGGAKLFEVDTDSKSVNDAIRFSATRRELYEQQRYRPTVYMLVWLRKDLLRWAETAR